jgi:hypothetical protein
MLKKSFRIIDHLSNNLKCKLQQDDDEDDEDDEDDDDNDEENEDKVFEIEYSYKFGKVLIEYLNTNDKYERTEFSSMGYTVIYNKDIEIRNEEFIIKYKVDEKSRRFKKIGRKNIEVFDYITTIFRIGGDYEEVNVENGEEEILPSVFIIRDGNYLNITKDGKNIFKSIQLEEAPVFNVFDNILLHADAYHLVSNKLSLQNFEGYLSIEDILSKEFYTTIRFEPQISKLYCSCFEGDKNVNFTFNPQNNIIDSIEIDNPGFSLMWNLVIETCSVVFKNVEYIFIISPNGQLITKNKKIAKNTFNNLKELVDYFDENQ